MAAVRIKAKPFNLLRWFSGFSLLAIPLLNIFSGYLLFMFLSGHLLERDTTITMQFIQSVSRIDNTEPYFHGSENPGDRSQLEESFRHITLMPDVLRATVYSKDQTIIWSSNDALIGQRFSDNDELQEALSGHLVFKHEHRSEHDDGDKIEHAYLSSAITDFVESYVPIWDKAQQEVIGVVEVYKAPTALFQTLDHGKWLIIIITVVDSILLYLVLFWVVRRGNRLIEQQHSALMEAEKFTAMGELTSSITRNLRNPLAAVRSSAELSLGSIEGPCREYMEDIISEVDRLDGWIRELLLMTQDDSSHQQRAVSLRYLITTALKQFNSRPAKQGVKIVVNIPDELPDIRVNPDAFIHILVSLVANALEAMPEGGELSIQGEYGKADVVLKLIDSGHGIPEQQLDQLFRPLNTHKIGGLGVGLPLARRMLQRYGGSLILSNRTDTRGTIVSLDLPVIDN